VLIRLDVGVPLDPVADPLPADTGALVLMSVPGAGPPRLSRPEVSGMPATSPNPTTGIPMPGSPTARMGVLVLVVTGGVVPVPDPLPVVPDPGLVPVLVVPDPGVATGSPTPTLPPPEATVPGPPAVTPTPEEVTGATDGPVDAEVPVPPLTATGPVVETTVPLDVSVVPGALPVDVTADVPTAPPTGVLLTLAPSPEATALGPMAVDVPHWPTAPDGTATPADNTSPARVAPAATVVA
jgi:hypothetical protein